MFYDRPMTFNPYQFDPSKMDPKHLMEMSRLIQQLPPDQLNRMQTLMHNMMAGFDVQSRDGGVSKRSLPPGFREKLVSVMVLHALRHAHDPHPLLRESANPSSLRKTSTKRVLRFSAPLPRNG